jgi:hypothetical protein
MSRRTTITLKLTGQMLAPPRAPRWLAMLPDSTDGGLRRCDAGGAAMSPRIAIGSALVAGALILGLALVATRVADIPMSTLTTDFQRTAGVPWYTGAVSVLNNMVWACVAVLSVFVAWLVPAERRRLLLFAGFVLVLAADDALLLHESVGPEHGVPEAVFLVAYGLVGLLLSWSMLRDANRGLAVTFLIGAALLALSIGFDLVFSDRFLLEDGAKLMGALVWLTLPPIVYGQSAIDVLGSDVRTHRLDEGRVSPQGSRSD